MDRAATERHLSVSQRHLDAGRDFGKGHGFIVGEHHVPGECP